MFLQILSLLLIILYIGRTLYLQHKGYTKGFISRVRYYQSNIIKDWVLPFFLLMLSPRILEVSVGDVLYLPELIQSLDLVTIAVVISTMPVILNVLPLNRKSPEVREKVSEIAGLPLAVLPANKSEWLWFTLFVMGGIVAEEFVFRHVLLVHLHQTLGWNGHGLLLAGALLFALSHYYQGLKGMFGHLINGYLWGAVYVLTGQFWVPVVLHVLLNSNALVLTAKYMNRR